MKSSTLGQFKKPRTDIGGATKRMSRSQSQSKKRGGRPNLKIKVKTKTWLDVVKGLDEDELETTDSVEKSDPNETDLVRAKAYKEAADADAYTEKRTDQGAPIP